MNGFAPPGTMAKKMDRLVGASRGAGPHRRTRLRLAWIHTKDVMLAEPAGKQNRTSAG